MTSPERAPERSTGGSLAAAAQQLLERRPPDATRRLPVRERRVDLAFATAFLLVAVALVLAFEPGAPRDVLRTAALVGTMAVLARVLVQVGAGFTVPTQVVFVPLLLLEPAALVPALVGVALVLSVLPEVVLRRAPAERLASAIADSWFAVTPAVLIAIAGDGGGPDWAAWPLYLAALLAQLLGDVVVSIAREWLGSDLPPGQQLHVMGQVSLFDALLAPVGLLAAFASAAEPYAFMLTLPGAAGLAVFARERARRIERALELVEELRAERARTVRAQRRIGETVAASLDRDALRRIVVETALELVDADGGRVSGRPSAADPLAEHARAGDLDAVDAAVEAVEAALADEPGLAEATIGETSAIGHHLRLHQAGGQVLEAVVVARRGAPFTPAERDLMRAFADQAAASVENLELHERFERQASTDELTGLLNHRRLQEVLAGETRLANRYGNGLALVMLDIDDFKRVNDTYGHQQGDRVLRDIARTVRGAVREVDHAARYGGEELAVALPQLDVHGAAAFAERLRGAIAALEVPLPAGGSMRVSASLGVAALGTHAHDRETLVAAADAALYRAKRMGKNRVVVADEPGRRFERAGAP